MPPGGPWSSWRDEEATKVLKSSNRWQVCREEGTTRITLPGVRRTSCRRWERPGTWETGGSTEVEGGERHVAPETDPCTWHPTKWAWGLRQRPKADWVCGSFREDRTAPHFSGLKSLRTPHSPTVWPAQENAEYTMSSGQPSHCRFQAPVLGLEGHGQQERHQRLGASLSVLGAACPLASAGPLCQFQEPHAHWPAQRPNSVPIIIQKGASWWGCSMGSSHKPPRACWTGVSREVSRWTETPEAPMLVSQQSNPQLVSACFVASTSGSSRSGGEERKAAGHP